LMIKTFLRKVVLGIDDNRMHSGLSLPLVTLACGSPYASLQPFRPFLTETPLPSSNTFVNDEKRLVPIGMSYNNRILVVVHTEKGDNIRIISARKATKKERKYYESDV